MKVTIYHIFFLLSFIVLSCSDTETGTLNEVDIPTQTMYLKLKNSSQTRSEVEPSQSEQAATVYTAIIYFMDNTNDPVCHAVRTVGATDADITIEQLREGALLEEIPNIATQVYVVGNWNSCDAEGNYADFPTVPGSTLSEIKATVLNINQVAYWELADGTVTGVTTSPETAGTVLKVAIMDGQTSLVRFETDPGGWGGGAGPANNDLYAEITLTPIVARLEFSAFVNSINSNRYTFNEIYINNYYQHLPLSLNRDGFYLTHNGDIAERYRPENSLFAYKNYRAMYIPFNTIINQGGNEDVRFSAGSAEDVFAYHIFGNTPPPQLISRFTNITFRDNSTAGERFCTIRFQQENGEELLVFERNKIYRPYITFENWGTFNGFENTFGGLTETPDPAPEVDIIVYLEVLDWVDVNVTTVLDD